MTFLLILILFLAGLAFGACHDVLTMTIPNWLSIAFAVVFLPAAILAGTTWEAIGWHYLTGLIGFVICIGLYALRVFGGGDAKLLPAVLIWIGPSAVIPYIYGIALSGGLLAILVLLARKLVPAQHIPGFLQRSVVEGPGIPYAIAIAFGALWAAKFSPVLVEIISQAGLPR